MTEAVSLHDQLVDISRDYLGPAAERFIERQITTHLHKQPNEITTQDVRSLVDWIKLAFALLTDDSKLVDEYAGRLQALSQARNIPNHAQ